MDEPPQVESFEIAENIEQQASEEAFSENPTTMEVDRVDDINQLETPTKEEPVAAETDESEVKNKFSENSVESNPKEQVEDQNVSLMDQDDVDTTAATEFDKTNASLDESSSLNFTEKSINFSQINADENDDSNDAFNALKETEVDVFSTKEELVEKTSAEEEQSEKDESVVQESEGAQDQGLFELFTTNNIT